MKRASLIVWHAQTNGTGVVVDHATLESGCDGRIGTGVNGRQRGAVRLSDEPDDIPRLVT